MKLVTEVYDCVKDANWQRAGEVFKEIMQQKVADRIDIERRTIFNEEKKPYVFECMRCGNIWRSAGPELSPGPTTGHNVICPKCHNKDRVVNIAGPKTRFLEDEKPKNESTTPGAAHAAYYKQHRITHIVAKKDLAAHERWMDSEGFDTITVRLPDNDRNAKTHVGIISKGNVESSYHVDGFAEPIKEGYLKEDKKPYVWECMDCENIWRSTQSGNTHNVRCPKCHSDDVLPGKFTSGRA